jgi:hypothetical protein
VRLWLPGLALSTRVRSPLLAPFAAGVKVTLRVQPCPPVNVLTQLSVSVKFPLVVLLAIVSGLLPWLVKAMDIGGLEVPMSCVPKSSPGAEKTIVGVLNQVEAVCGDTLSVLLALNCIRSRLPSPLKSPAVNPRG